LQVGRMNTLIDPVLADPRRMIAVRRAP
jgi:hypothetical protein